NARDSGAGCAKVLRAERCRQRRVGAAAQRSRRRALPPSAANDERRNQQPSGLSRLWPHDASAKSRELARTTRPATRRRGGARETYGYRRRDADRVRNRATDHSAAVTASAPDPGRPLAGLQIVALGALIAGPFCAKILAEFGADVV